MGGYGNEPDDRFEPQGTEKQPLLVNPADGEVPTVTVCHFILFPSHSSHGGFPGNVITWRIRGGCLHGA